MSNDNVVGLDGQPFVPDDFEVGEITGLVSGGPDLTVLDYCADCDAVTVVWFDGSALQYATLPGAVLD